MTGYGDIAPDVPAARAAASRTIANHLVGVFAGLIAVIVVGGDVHHRRVPAGPDPHHAGRQPAAWPGAGRQGDRGRPVTFVLGLVAAAIAVLVGSPMIRAQGKYVLR